MNSVFLVSDPAAWVGRVRAPRPSRPAAQTPFIGAAEGRHIGRSARRGKRGKDT